MRLGITDPLVGPLVTEESTDWVVSGPEEELDGDAVSALALDVTSGLPASMVDVVSVEICVSEPPREELDDEGKLISTLELDAKPDEAGLMVDVVSVEVCVSACPREESTDEVELVSTLSLDV